jgi:hypothetical protein
MTLNQLSPLDLSKSFVARVVTNEVSIFKKTISQTIVKKTIALTIVKKKIALTATVSLFILQYCDINNNFFKQAAVFNQYFQILLWRPTTLQCCTSQKNHGHQATP